MHYHWNLLEVEDEQDVKRLAKELNISDILCRLLILRGIKTFDQSKLFFRPSLEHLHDPYLMKDMHIAIERIKTAMNIHEKILIYGDYDVDGTTAVSVVYDFLSKRYAEIDYYIPDRYTEGYGVSFQGIDYAVNHDFKLIITLDCGIKAVEKIEYAQSKGIDVIICDHHTPGEQLPPACAIINPKQKDCPYPYKELPGCGIGFKLIQAFALKENIDLKKAYHHLDLVAVAIACDIVPITGENRVIAYYGLKKINDNKASDGIRALLDIAQSKKPKVSVEDLVFKVGPRINAAGRIEHGKRAVELLIHPNPETIEAVATAIDEKNAIRRGIDQQITAEALAMVEENQQFKEAKSTVLYKEDWHKGVIGIVASRLIESYYRPTIVFTQSNGVAAGSARSVKNYNVYDAIDACSELIEQFGGHKYAAGLTIKIENIEPFRKKFEEVVSSTISSQMLVPEIEIDAEINFQDITPKFIRILNQFAPFGPHNMRPVFITRNVIDAEYTALVGQDKKHIKFYVHQLPSMLAKMKGIGFNLGEHFDRIKAGEKFDMVYTIEENHWNGEVRYEMNVRDIRFSE